MVEHKFGGEWTAQKLGCVEDYARAWAQIMGYEAPKWGWRTRYIDAFSGTGSYVPKLRLPKRDDGPSLFGDELSLEEREEVLKGSARIALDMVPAFHRIDLIEANTHYAKTLENLAGNRLNDSVYVHCADANVALARIASEFTSTDRAVAFIDPYDCQVHWNTLATLADRHAVDVWYLFPLMGVNRRLVGQIDKMPDEARETLSKVLGTSDWEEQFYRAEKIEDLLGDYERTSRRAGPNAVEKFFLKRLETIFPYVHQECLRLRNSKNGEMFSLIFAMGNPSDAAKKAAKRLANDAIRRWNSRR